MARNPNVAELKRDRLPLDLESVRLWQRERERREQEKQAQSGRVTTTEVPPRLPQRRRSRKHGEVGPHYKWVALSNTTIGMLMATVNSSIVLISLPAIFRGIKLNPLVPSNVSYLLWMIMGYMVVTAVLVVSLGRIGDMFGRVRLYNLGFLVFTVGSILLSLVFTTGPTCGARADPFPARSGRWRGDDLRLLHGDPHRRVSRNENAAWRWGSTRLPRCLGIVHRADRRWLAEHHGLAPRVPGVGAGRLVRDRVGVPQAA